MRIPAVCFAVTLLAAIPVFARQKTDLIVMNNGDRITCEVKGLNEGALSIAMDYVDGTVSVDWSKVVRLESNQPFVVLGKDGSSYEGKLSTGERATGEPLMIHIVTRDNKVEIERSRIVRMTETSEKLYQRFNGSINFGVIYSKGNSATQYSLSTETQYLRERWAANALLSSDLSSSTGSTTSTRNQLGLRGYHLLPWENYFYGGLGNFLQSSEQGITLQTTLGGGIGHFFKNTNRTSIAVLGGSAWQSTDYKPSATSLARQNVAAALVAMQIKAFKFSRTNLAVSAALLPALSQPGRVFLSTNTSYYLKLFNNLSWNISFYGNWDNRPPPGFSGSDYGTSSGVSWTFGNR
ncbi:MAG TPA: DUF481 domain-containing protein [Terriglobales bacterium]|nr:DUF481 domain-containing protein [Terriglobales bacterium]